MTVDDSFTVALVDNEFVHTHWSELEAALQDAFAGASFINPDFDPVQHTLAGVEGRLSWTQPNHVLAFDSENRVVGAVFCIPSRGDGGSCDIGWMFIARTVATAQRNGLIDALVKAAFQAVRDAGFTSIVTEMGTHAGARLFCNRYGFVHEPTTSQPNRWVRDPV